MNIVEVAMNVKLKLMILILCMVKMVAEGFYKFQIKWLTKHKKPLIGDIITIINRLRIACDYEKVNVIHVNITKISKLKQGLDLIFTSKSTESDYDNAFNNLYGIVETSSDYSDLLYP